MSVYRTFVKRGIVIFAIAWFCALGSGAVEYAHNGQHEREDARLTAPTESKPIHDDSNCAFHAQLHVPLIQTPVVALLICLGLLVAFLTQFAQPLISSRTPARIDCRGPPAFV